MYMYMQAGRHDLSIDSRVEVLIRCERGVSNPCPSTLLSMIYQSGLRQQVLVSSIDSRVEGQILTRMDMSYALYKIVQMCITC